MSAKPRLILRTRDGVPVPEPVDPVERARARFGRPFCFEPGSTFKPRERPLLQDWLAARNREKV